MPVNPDIRDQAYRFFIEEVPELLQILEGSLLELRQERSTTKIHDLMRTAHTLKGGAAGVELEAIATLAHRLENIFKALYDETIEIDAELESQLLQAYDCLYLPLIEQLKTGKFDAEQALATAEPIFSQIEERLGDALAEAENFYLPSSAELGVDMTISIFKIDVAQGLENLSNVVANPQDYQLAAEIQSQAEVFIELADILNKPGLGEIAEATLAALKAQPQQALTIAQLALADFQVYREAVLAGKITSESGPSAALLELAQAQSTEFPLEEDNFAGDWSQEFSAQVTEEEDPGVGDWSQDLSTPVNQEQNDDFEELPFPLTSSQEEGSEQEIWTVFAEDITEKTSVSIAENNQELDSLSIFEEESADQPWEDIFESTLASPETETSVDYLSWLTSSGEELPSEPENVVETTDIIPTSETAIIPLENFEEEPNSRKIPVPQSQLLTPQEEAKQVSAKTKEQQTPITPQVTVRVDSNRLERMDNLAGEAAIKRSGLYFENRQLQTSVQEMLSRFTTIEQIVEQLRKASDQTLVPLEGSPFSRSGQPQDLSIKDKLVSESEQLPSGESQVDDSSYTSYLNITNKTDFDSLEMDSYGALHSLLQRFSEDMVQLRESVDDIALFAKQSDRNLEQLRKMLTHLQDEIMWARMLPLGEVLNRFPRILRDLSSTYNKPVSLKINGTGVLVDRAVLERIYDPLLHLLRNAFDHGIEMPEVRRAQGKSEQGEIEIKARHKGGQTIIEIKDDGQGLNLERIGHRALEMGLLSEEQLANVSEHRLFDLIFEPGFSTAEKVSELSGRGVGLDVVRAQLRLLKGTISINSERGVGTTFTLRLPLTLTSAKLIVGFVDSTVISLPSDSIEEIIVPKAEQINKAGTQRFLRWRGEVIPIHRLADLLKYSCPVPENSPSRALLVESSAPDSTPPLLVLHNGQQTFALEIDHLVTEQKLVIKPFGGAVAPPTCTYGCTILGDGSLVPVVDGATLFEQSLAQDMGSKDKTEIQADLGTNSDSPKQTTNPKVLIVDDAVSLRRTLALTLEKAGYRVLQAGDGREAIKQLERSSEVKLVICDIEMPNMNGFDFMNHRRQVPQLENIPVIMLTSRGNDKHRRLAMHLGAAAYFTKPYLEQSFLPAIREIMSQGERESMPVLK